MSSVLEWMGFLRKEEERKGLNNKTTVYAEFSLN